MIALQFLIVKILDVYILGIGILFFIMGINFIAVIIPVWMVYQQILVNIMSLKKLVSWPQYFPNGKSFSEAIREKFFLYMLGTGFLVAGVSMGYEE